MKKRDKIILAVIFSIVGFLILENILPIGDGNWNEKQINKINSENSSGRFCFAVMGDNKNGFSTFNNIIDDVNNKKPLFAIDVGDLVYDGEKGKYRIFYDTILKSEVPFLVGIGNHDITEGGRANYFDIFGNFYYSFSYNNSLFIVLDNANQVNIDPQQMKFLDDELKKNFENKFVFMHVPPFDPREYVKIFGFNQSVEHRMSDQENAKEFMDLVSKYNVTNVFASHIHGYFNETRENISYIITGGAGGEMVTADPQHYFYHYIETCVNGGNVTYNVVKFKSPGQTSVDRLLYTGWLYFSYFVVVNKYQIVVVILFLALIWDIFHKEIKEFLKNFRGKKTVNL